MGKDASPKRAAKIQHRQKSPKTVCTSKVLERVAEIDIEDDSESDGNTASTVSGYPIFLPKKPCTCRLCASTSNQNSPFQTAKKSDMYGGKRPWKTYVKKNIIKDGKKEVHRVPMGRTCLPCWNVFRIRGFELGIE